MTSLVGVWKIQEVANFSIFGAGAPEGVAPQVELGLGRLLRDGGCDE
jgi:hypothetical protein